MLVEGLLGRQELPDSAEKPRWQLQDQLVSLGYTAFVMPDSGRVGRGRVLDTVHHQLGTLAAEGHCPGLTAEQLFDATQEKSRAGQGFMI